MFEEKRGVNMSDIAGNGCDILVPFNERKPLKEVERSIIKTYRKHIWSKFIKAIKDYKLIEDGDKILVAISGGKDSMLMAKLFQELQRHGQMKFEVRFVCMDPGYHPDIKDRKSTRLNSSHANISYAVFCLKKKHISLLDGNLVPGG